MGMGSDLKCIPNKLAYTFKNYCALGIYRISNVLKLLFYCFIYEKYNYRITPKNSRIRQDFQFTHVHVFVIRMSHRWAEENIKTHVVQYSLAISIYTGKWVPYTFRETVLIRRVSIQFRKWLVYVVWRKLVCRGDHGSTDGVITL